jgi:hypothetical protein
MSSFSIFSYLDPAVIADETSSTPRASYTPAMWPSEASAVRIDKSMFPIFGTCMRKCLYRMIGWTKSVETDASGPWKWILGRAVEEKLTDLAQFQSEKAGIEHIYVANGVRLFIRDFYLPVEIDLIVKDPKTNRGWVVECKSYSGYYAEKEIEKESKPKVENLIQTCIYLIETKTGALLKELIKSSLAEREALDAKSKFHRNRCEANLEMVEALDDGPLGCKLVYINRGTLERTEFDIEIMEDYDGFHYPVVNGIPYKIFTIESIYDRFRTGQNYWFRMRQEAVDRLSAKGIEAPATLNLILSRSDIVGSQTESRELTKEQLEAEKVYYDLLEKEVRALPEEFFPKPEYEWSYSPKRVEELFAASLIPKTKYGEYKKGKIVRLGDWQCAYCVYAKMGCIAKQRPDLAFLSYDLANISEDSEVSIG